MMSTTLISIAADPACTAAQTCLDASLTLHCHVILLACVCSRVPDQPERAVWPPVHPKDCGGTHLTHVLWRLLLHGHAQVGGGSNRLRSAAEGASKFCKSSSLLSAQAATVWASTVPVHAACVWLER
jgi:hypothetical protein